MRQLLILVYFVLTIMPTHQQIDLLTTPIVGIELSESGFHRNLIYTVQFDYPLAGRECEYLLRQQLPASVYISVDQLDDLKRLKKLNAIYPQFVDIEKPTEQSTDFEVFIRGMPRVVDTVVLPIHFRYHAPSDQDSFLPVDLITPTMYIKCSRQDQAIIDRELNIEANPIHCLDETVPTIKEYSKSDIHSDGVSCNWKSLKIAFQLKSSLHTEIPIGNESAHPSVLYITIIVSWVISLWTVFRTRHIPIAINEKLEEQRLLQRKTK